MVAGRPKVKIDWERVKSLLMAGCNGAQIAGDLGIYPLSLYRRCEEEFGIKFSEFLQQHRSKGDALILAQRYAKALGRTDKGDNSLLIWLGKTRLGESESKELKASLTVNTVNYADAAEDNPSPQVPAEGLPTQGAEGA